MEQLEQLYVAVLYTIRHKIGAHSAKYPHHYKQDLVSYAQAAFSFTNEQHRTLHAIASEEKVSSNIYIVFFYNEKLLGRITR